MLRSVSSSLTQVKTVLDIEDVQDALEQAESLMGIAFVTSQTYIAKAIADARKLAKSPKPTKQHLLAHFSEIIPRTGLTKDAAL